MEASSIVASHVVHASSTVISAATIPSVAARIIVAHVLRLHASHSCAPSAVGASCGPVVVRGTTVTLWSVFGERLERVGVGIGVADCEFFRILLAFAKRFDPLLRSGRCLGRFEKDVGLPKLSSH